MATFAGVGSADARTDGAPLTSRLDRALAVHGVSGAATGALAIDLVTGAVVYSRNADRPLIPASNEKLIVALAALVELGADFRFGTEVLGEGVQEGTVWQGDLVLKGYGDPSLHRPDLRRLAKQVRAAGIRRVTRRVLGDESFFDAMRTAPGWKPSFYIEESAPLSALIVDRAKERGVTSSEPALAAAETFREELIAAGVKVAHKAAAGLASPDAAPLAGVISEPLRRIVRWMNQESDNFVAEMLLKGLGARIAGAGTTTAGAQVARDALAELGVPLGGVRLIDGSGLARGDRLTAGMLAALLVAAWNDPVLKDPFVDSLAVAGINGTLEDRLESPPTRGHVRAKTGTTDVASTLAGYVGERYAFAILMNGHPIPWWHARRGQDRFVSLLAAQ